MQNFRFRKLEDGHLWGTYSFPNNLIRIERRLGELDRLDTLIHELLHYLDRSVNRGKIMLTEKQVEKFGRRMARVLWRDGWRRP